MLSPILVRRAACVGFSWPGLTATLVSAAIAATSAERFMPSSVILDTDIGTDIDDAYALALIMQSRN
ncbi:MAG: hypothetical protein WDM96_13880 [Lacunisphaera sp.]